jgi:hypothetical protein
MSPISLAMDAAMSSGHLFKRFTELPLYGLKAWSDNVPFKMDALGLVTLLGADQVSTAIGSLQRRRYTGALPLLAAFVLAGDRFTSIEPGFTLYNLTDGIASTAMSGWFTRWLMCQNVNRATTTFEWKLRLASREPWWTRFIAMTVSGLLVIPLIICTVLMGDWYGVANAGAIVVSIAARLYILGQQRYARDRYMEQPPHSLDLVDKLFIVERSDGKMVTLRAAQCVINGIVLQGKPVTSLGLYSLAQQAAWVALGTHLLVLGMCTLVTQIYTVILLVSSTVAVSSTTDWFPDTQHVIHSRTAGGGSVTSIPFNNDWDVIKTDPAVRTEGNDGITRSMDKRQVAWARLGLDDLQEATMFSWQLFPPMDNNPSWWEHYRILRDDFAAARGQNSDTCSPPSSNDISLQAIRPSVRSLNHSNTSST